MNQRIQCELKTTKAKRKHTLRQTQEKFSNIFSVCVFSVVYLKKIYFSCFNDVSSILCSLLASANVYDVLCETFIVCGSFPRKPKLEFIAIYADCGLFKTTAKDTNESFFSLLSSETLILSFTSKSDRKYRTCASGVLFPFNFCVCSVQNKLA